MAGLRIEIDSGVSRICCHLECGSKRKIGIKDDA